MSVCDKFFSVPMCYEIILNFFGVGEVNGIFPSSSRSFCPFVLFFHLAPYTSKNQSLVFRPSFITMGSLKIRFFFCYEFREGMSLSQHAEFGRKEHFGVFAYLQ